MSRIGAAHAPGFTLIELLVVIIIIGILSAVAVPIYLHQRTKTQVATLKTDLRAASQMTETWYADGYTNTDATDFVSGYGYLQSTEPGVIFPRSATTEMRSPGMDPVRLTHGTGMTIRAVASFTPGYCVLGVRRGTPYDYGTDGAPGGAEFSRLLFYDSLLGGIRTRAELTASGACATWR